MRVDPICLAHCRDHGVKKFVPRLDEMLKWDFSANRLLLLIRAGSPDWKSLIHLGASAMTPRSISGHKSSFAGLPSRRRFERIPPRHGYLSRSRDIVRSCDKLIVAVGNCTPAYLIVLVRLVHITSVCLSSRGFTRDAYRSGVVHATCMRLCFRAQAREFETTHKRST
jgi:hypothetical protein